MEPRNGFTLVELMIVVAIIGILAAIAYPSYNQYLIRTHRSAAESFMMNVANREEQYLLDRRQYTATLGSGGLNLVTPPEVSRYYTVTIPSATTTTYTIQAAPTSAQPDSLCGTLTLTETGAKGAGATDCW